MDPKQLILLNEENYLNWGSHLFNILLLTSIMDYRHPLIFPGPGKQKLRNTF